MSVLPRSTPPRREPEQERLDRNLIELLNELRVALPGVQVLFAFLLVVPFNQRFAATTAFQRALYLVVLALTAAAGVCLIAPSFHHRVTFRRRQKERIVVLGNRLAVIGLTLLAMAMTGTVGLIVDFLLGNGPALAAGGAAAALFAAVWALPPLWRWRRD